MEPRLEYSLESPLRASYDVTMKVAIIAPPVSLTPVSVFPRHPPLLAAQLAATVRNSGAEVVVLDAFQENLSVSDTVSAVLAESPDAVVIMPNDVARETPAAITGAISSGFRRAGGSAVLIAAGVGNIKWMRELVTEVPCLDGAVVGDPEEAVPELLGAIAAGAAWQDMPFVVTGTLPSKQVRPAVLKHLDTLPIPAWDLVGLDKYVVLAHRKLRGIEYPIFASRGCYWNRCTFCQDLACVKSPDYRMRSPEAVVSEMEAAATTYGAKHFLFHDGVFPNSVRWLERFANAVDASGLQCTWFCMARADGVTPEKLRLMKRAGCKNMCYGLESGSEQLLRDMDKGQTLEQARDAVRWTKAAGIEVSATFVFGFPGETVEMASRTIEFAVELDVDYAQFMLVKWHHIPELGLSPGSFSEEWELTQYDYRGMVFVPSSYGSLSRLKFVRSYAFARFYLRPSFFLKVASKIGSLNDLRRFAQGGATLVSAMLNK